MDRKVVFTSLGVNLRKVDGVVYAVIGERCADSSTERRNQLSQPCGLEESKRI
jgi:hypothetical protein